MTRKQRRLTLIGAGLGVLGLAAGLVLYALNDSIVFFNSPSDIVEQHVAANSRIRMGGLVKPGSVQRGEAMRITFAVTDKSFADHVPIITTGYGRADSVDGSVFSASTRLSATTRAIPKVLSLLR